MLEAIPKALMVSEQSERGIYRVHVLREKIALAHT